MADAIEQAVRDLFQHGQESSLDPWLTEGVELRPPTYEKSWSAKPLVSQLLRYAAASMTGLRYTDVLSADGMYVLRFEAQVGTHSISGVDFIRTGEDGKIVLFEIFARPPKAALALLEAMGAHVRSNPGVARLMGLG